MKKTNLLILTIFIGLTSFSQVEEDTILFALIEEDTSAIEFDGETLEISGSACLPHYVGGELAMMKFLGDTIKYPELAAELGIQGVVYVEFAINKDGSIEQVNAIHGPDESLECEAEKAIASMPKWEPAICNGKAFRISYTLPITFSLH
ncbi:MAG: TonB family protein [Arenicella sp.]|jgi:TonB family protein